MSTLSEMTANVFRRLNESSSAPVHWTEDDIHESLNEGYLDLCERARLVEREAEVTCVQGVPYMDARWALAYPFLGLRRMLARVIDRPLRPTTVKARDDRDRRWEMSTGQVQRFFVRGLYIIGLWPVPSTCERFRTSWTSLPARMVDADESPEIPEELHPALEEYAMYDLKAMETETDIALGHWKEYLSYSARAQQYAKDQIKTSRTFVMGRPQPTGWSL